MSLPIIQRNGAQQRGELLFTPPPAHGSCWLRIKAISSFCCLITTRMPYIQSSGWTRASCSPWSFGLELLIDRKTTRNSTMCPDQFYQATRSQGSITNFDFTAAPGGISCFAHLFRIQARLQLYSCPGTEAVCSNYLTVQV